MVINKDIDIVFKVPAKKDMEILEKWYGMHDYFGYATGFKNFSDIIQKFDEPVNPSLLSFMIYNMKNKTPIGFFYGYIKDASKNAVLWISIFIIDPGYQNKGYGTHALIKLLNFAQREYGIAACIAAVSYRNKQGLSFWEKVGFSHDPELEQSLHHFGTSQVAIMKKILKQ